jgi:hypothetical protein
MDPSVHSYAIWKYPRSLAHVWTCSSQKAMLKALKRILIKYGKIEFAQAQEFNKVFSFILEYTYAVLSRGTQLSELTKSKCSLVDLSEI